VGGNSMTSNNLSFVADFQILQTLELIYIAGRIQKELTTVHPYQQAL